MLVVLDKSCMVPCVVQPPRWKLAVGRSKRVPVVPTRVATSTRPVTKRPPLVSSRSVSTVGLVVRSDDEMICFASAANVGESPSLSDVSVCVGKTLAILLSLRCAMVVVGDKRPMSLVMEGLVGHLETEAIPDWNEGFVCSV